MKTVKNELRLFLFENMVIFHSFHLYRFIFFLAACTLEGFERLLSGLNIVCDVLGPIASVNVAGLRAPMKLIDYVGSLQSVAGPIPRTSVSFCTPPVKGKPLPFQPRDVAHFYFAPPIRRPTTRCCLWCYCGIADSFATVRSRSLVEWFSRSSRSNVYRADNGTSLVQTLFTTKCK